MINRNWRKALAAVLAGTMVLGGSPAAVFASDSTAVVSEAAAGAESGQAAETEQPDLSAQAEGAAETQKDTEETAETEDAKSAGAAENDVQEAGQVSVQENAQAAEEAAEEPEQTSAKAALADETSAASTAESTQTEDKDIYVLMNIPYSVFYGLVGAGEVDTVASATTKVRDSERAGASYNGSGNAKNTDGTTSSKGAQIPVRVNTSVLADSRYTEVTDSTSYTTVAVLHGTATDKTYTGKAALIQADDYAYYKLSDTPKYYFTLTADGFGSLTGDTVKVDGTSSDITFGGRHRTYELTFPSEVTGQVAAVKVVTDKLTFGLRTTDQIFNKDKEIGWDPEGTLADTNGATLESYTVYTDEGVYEVSVNKALKKKNSDEVSAVLSDETGTLSGLPSDIENAKVTVSTGSGKSAAAVTGLEGVTLTNGTFEIPEDTLESDGTQYTVTVSSDNYVNISASAVYNETIYVLMNIPYSDFEKAVGSSDDVDTVASATTKVRDAERAGAIYNGSGNATNTENVTDVAKGVQFAVRVNTALLTDEKYSEVTDSTSYTTVAVLHGQATDETYTGKAALIQADDYAYYRLSDTPVNYLELTSDGFGSLKGRTTTYNDGEADITYGGHHRTYEVKLADGISGTVAAVKVVTDTKTFWLKPTDEIFNKDKEFGWDPTGDLADTNGATLQSYTVYTDAGVYSVTVGQKLTKKLYSDEITASIAGLGGEITGLPEDIENPTATVSVTTGSGHSAVTTKYVTDAKVVNGTFVIPADADLENGKEYDVTVSGDNYIDMTTTAKYDSTVYVLMNIPYSVFEKAEGTSTDVDAVASATTKVRNAGLAGATYNGGGNATDTSDVKDAAKGVQFAVQVADVSLLKDYTQVTNDTSYKISYMARGAQTDATLTGKAALIQADDYAYYALGSEPALYMELTEGGFSKVKGKSVTNVTDSSPEITYGGHHQTYEISLPSSVTGTIAAVKVVTDKATFWLRPTDGIWRSIEIGWSPKNELASTNGATLQSYKVYTSDNIYDVTVGTKLKTVSSNAISATLSGTKGTVSSLPSDIADAKVTVYTTTGSGSNAVTTTYINQAALTNGSFTIPASAGLKNGTTYKVTVSSSNYLDFTAEAAYKAVKKSTKATGAGSLTAETKSLTSASGKKTLTKQTFRGLRAYSTTQTNNSITLRWTKVSGAATYTVFRKLCGKSNKYTKIGTVKGTAVRNTSLKKGTYYVYYIVAADKNEKVLATSASVHVATKGGKVGNYKSVKLSSKKSVSLKRGKTSKIRASAVKASKLKVNVHRKLTYESSNTKVATVSSSGKITAKKKGTCTIYVYAQNGVYKTVKVTVK